MAETKQVAVTIYMQTQTLIGFIYSYGERLSDVLNSLSPRREDRGRFVELHNVTIQHPDGREERLATSYINKAAIQLVTTTEGDLAKGIGGQVGAKPYPFVEKLPVSVRLQVPAYTIMGNLHCVSRGMTWHALEEKPMFMPLTNVSICQSDNSNWWRLSFAAVNRDQILSLIELETSPMGVRGGTGI